MAIQANRVRSKSHIGDIVKLVWFVLRRGFASLLLVISLLLVASNADTVSRYSLEIVGRTVEASSLLFRGASDGVLFVSNKISLYRELEAQNTKLKIEVAKLQGAKEQNAILKSENDSLKELLHVKQRSNVPFISAKLLSISKTPYSSTAIIAAGLDDGVAKNDIVVSSKGLVGRIIEVSSGYSSVMLIDDYNSRIPVRTSQTTSRGILAIHDGEIKLIYLQNDILPKIGEIVYSSGDGKIYPDGIKIGRVTKISPKGVYVEPEVLGKNARPLDQDFIMIQSLGRTE